MNFKQASVRLVEVEGYPLVRIRKPSFNEGKEIEKKFRFPEFEPDAALSEEENEKKQEEHAEKKEANHLKAILWFVNLFAYDDSGQKMDKLNSTDEVLEYLSRDLIDAMIDSIKPKEPAAPLKESADT